MKIIDISSERSKVGSSPKDLSHKGGLTYDLNGNIGALTRKGSTGSDMDALAYSYTGNQLQYVNDTSGDAEGFDNNNTGTNIDYIYDPNGNMTQDLNKGISSIQYNHLNLPTAVILNDSEGSHTINYLYDAAGIKLQQKVYDGGVLAKTTDYVGEFIYETVGTGTRQLQLIQHVEGRLTPLPGGVGGGFDYQYHLKDHLGNVRLTFSTTPENYQMVETFETGETNGFEDLHRFTSTNANTTSGGNEVERLQSGQTGAMVFLSLNKGDTVDLSVQANYETAPSGNNFLQTAYNTLFTSFDNVYGSGVEGGVTSTSTEFSDAISGTNMAGKSGSSTAPRAFLNYIIFDKGMNYVNAGFAQISTAAQGIGVHESVSLNDVIADREGYILAYLSNENTEAVSIHWDDFTVYHGKTNVVQADDYYPFGGAFNSYSRTASTPQKFLYNGKELQEETQWYDYGARMYDAAIGRWNHIDPAGEEYFSVSPYVYALNNPINAIDPDGKRVFFVAGAGNDPDGWNYVSRFGNAFSRAGIRGFTPINATGGRLNDIAFTSNYRNSSYESYSTGINTDGYAAGLYPGTNYDSREVQHDKIGEAITQIQQNLADNPLEEGEQFNLAGYSYGSVLQAQVALKLANDGQYIDNLILIGSPISDDSDLFKQLSGNENIGNVLRVDIEGDLLSNPQDVKNFILGLFKIVQIVGHILI